MRTRSHIGGEQLRLYSHYILTSMYAESPNEYGYMFSGLLFGTIALPYCILDAYFL